MSSSVLLPRDEQIRGRATRVESRRVLTYIRCLDWLLVGSVIGVCVLGLDVLRGATLTDVPHDPLHYVHLQELYMVVGGIGAMVALVIPPGFYRRLQWPIALLALASIAMVLAVGSSAGGGQRWIQLPAFQFQPSELGKLALVLCLSAFIADRRERIGSWRLTIAVLLYASVAALLVFVEPDFGTALVYGGATLGILFVAGVPWKHFAALFASLAVLVALVFSVLPAAGVHVVKDYQVQRLTQFLHPERDPSGAGYNQYQARIAVGSGGIAGRGVAGATQTQGNFLPEHHTDFIFATLGEQRGFIGAALLLGLYLVMLWRMLRAVTVSATLFGSLVCGGAAVWLLFSIFVNVGMSIGLAPVTGIPLPFMSYGGSSTIVALYTIGVVQAIQLRGRLPRSDAKHHQAAP